MSETASESGFLGDLGRERAIILGGLMLGMLLGSIDQSIVSTALPTIVGDLGGAGSLSWIVTAYLITTAVTTPLYGKLSDIYGRSIIYEFAIAVFLIGSALSGLAGDIPILDDHVSGMAQLAIFRAIQGVGAGGLIAMATTILGDIFSPRERGKYMSYMMLIFGASTIAGPLLGGFLTDNFTWRWIFYINIPVGLAAISVIYAKLDLPVPNEDHKIDYLGAVLLTVAVTALMLVTTWGGSRYDWDSTRILGLAAVAVVFAIGFVVQELRVPEPIFPIHLLRKRTVAGVDLLSFVVGIGLLGGTTFLPVYLQTVLGRSATNSGLLLLPLVGGLMITSALTGQLMTRFGRYKPFTVAGGAVGACGYFLLSTMGPDTTQLWSSVFMFVAGLGMGFIMPTLTIAVQNVVDRKNLGVATTSVTFSRTLGSGIGVAVFGAILTNQLTDRLANSALNPAAAQQLANAGSNISPQVLAKLPAEAVPIVRTALANSIDQLFLAGAVILGFAFLVALTLPSVELGEEANVEMGEGGETPSAGGETGAEPAANAGTNAAGRRMQSSTDGGVNASGRGVRSSTDGGVSTQKPSRAETMGNGPDPAASSMTPSPEDTDASSWRSETTGEFHAAEESHPIGTRRVTPRIVRPGGDVTVRIELGGMSGRLLLSEAVSDGDVIREVSPEPVERMRIDGVVYVSWDLTEPADVVVEYTTSVAESAADGATIPFEGSVVLVDETRPVGGRTEIEVVTDFFEWRLLDGEVTNRDIELAGQYLADGTITRKQYERLHRQWQTGSPVDERNVSGAGGERNE